MTWNPGCLHCNHWWHDARRSEYESEDEAPQQAWCTLNPAWVKTAQKHFCSHMTGIPDKQAAAEYVITRGRMNWLEKSNNTERAQRIKLQKELKEAKRLLREATKGK